MSSRRPLWKAHGLVEVVSSRFRAARGAEADAIRRDAFFLLTHYYARTLVILRQAIAGRREPLAEAALLNASALHLGLQTMHRVAPRVVPLALPLTEAFVDRWRRDRILATLDLAPDGLTLPALAAALVGANVLGGIEADDLAADVAALEGLGKLRRAGERVRAVPGDRADLGVQAAVMASLLGGELAAALAADGFDGVFAALARPAALRTAFCTHTGLGPRIADLFVQVLIDIRDALGLARPGWRHRDLLHSGVPRPYQLEAFAVLRGSGYRNGLVEAPTGSGKTLLGMLCIQDWLPSLATGQTVLVLVPTSNYQRQWVRELCFIEHGLRLAPEAVFAGPPAALGRLRSGSGPLPAVLVLTYAAIAQRVADHGVADLPRFLAAHGVTRVVFDEAHKLAGDPDSPTGQAARVLTDLRTRGVLAGVIGMSGTLTPHVDALARLGLTLVHAVPLMTLVAHGFVAPFAELAVPFTFSDRERALRATLEAFKALVRAFVELAGPAAVRARFRAIAPDLRATVATRLLAMYTGRRDALPAALTRLASWDTDGPIDLSTLRLVSLVQLVHGLGDAALVDPKQHDALAELLTRATALRTQALALAGEGSPPELAGGLPLDGTLDATRTAPLVAAAQAGAPGLRAAAEQALSGTLLGSWDLLGDLFLRMGEGRVSTIRGIIAAERRSRPVSGVIVFERGGALRVRDGVARPGYAGVAGLFSELLSDPAVHPLAALSEALYLPGRADGPLPRQIVAFIEQTLIRGELAAAVSGLLLAGLEPESDLDADLPPALDELLTIWLAQRSTAWSRPTLTGFTRTVLSPLRKRFARMSAGLSREDAAQLRRRLRLRGSALRVLVEAIFDYAAVAWQWRNPDDCEVVQASGGRQRCAVVRMPAGRRQQLMYDLVARLVDHPEMPIDVVVVSSWARTGWNVHRPNVVIDATATRDPVAWQQLRGRGLRADRGWSIPASVATTLLIGGGPQVELPADAKATLATIARGGLDPRGTSARGLLLEQLSPDETRRFTERGVAGLTADERLAAAVRLQLARNKVTHIYELLKASGSTPQVQRIAGEWRRPGAIAAKHDHEVGVVLATGGLASGEEHAPLIHAGDPRSDAPAELSAAVFTAIDGRDGEVVAAWMRAARGR